MPKKQKSGLYRTAVTVNGKKVWISAHTKAELEDKKRQVKEKLIYGKSLRPITFHELVHRWWDDIRSVSGVRPSTIQNDRSMINNIILRNIDSRQLAQAVRRADLQRVINAMANGHNAARCRKVRGHMSAICKYGMELGVMTADYAHNVIITPDSQPREQREPVPNDVMLRMLDAVQPPFDTSLAILYYAGLRKGEVCALLWSDIDFDQCVIHVTKQFDSITRMISRPKTVNSIRDVHMPEQLVSILRKRRGTPAAPVGVNTVAKLEYHWVKTLHAIGLAHHIEGKPVSFYYSNYDFQYCPHQVRHTYATMLHDAGIDPVTASRIMGHSSYTTTADIYTAIDERQKASSNDRIDKAFSKKFAAK